MTGKLTLEMIQEAFDSIRKNSRQRQDNLVISAKRYDMAKKAEEEGASPREVMYIAMGASPEQAKELASDERQRDF